MTTETSPVYYSVSEAARRLGVSRVSVWRWIRDGRLPVWRLGHRTVRIKQEDLERIMVPAGPEGARAPRATWREAHAGEHFVQFYEADAFLSGAVAEYVGAGLRAGEAAIVIATPEHLAEVETRLSAAGVHLETPRAKGQYVALDAAETLARFMVDGSPDAARFDDVVGSVVASAAEHGHVRTFGEMVALLALEGNHKAAIRLEDLWNELRARHDFSLFCAYPMDRLGGDGLAEFVGAVCTAHARVLPAESYGSLATADERLREVAALQQKAQSLEAALAAERAARAEAEAALRARDEFLSVAAHELKTPVTSVRGYAQLALRRLAANGEISPETMAGHLEVIVGQAGRLSRLVEQLLDLSRIESGKLAVERQPADLVALADRAVASARLWSDGHTLALSAPESVTADVDSIRIEQVLTNLLDNAIKYSPNGGPIQVVLVHDGPGYAELSVRDRGLGIPPARRERIFERFYQAHEDTHRSGMGLGLHISRQIVELHGGTIRAEFPEDGGTRMVVRLPLG